MKLLLIIIFMLMWARISLAESVTLRWDAPITNTDATPLTDLAGFKIYYGTAIGVYGTTVDVGHTLCAVISGLTAGTTYYFAATAYDISANESGYSNEVNKLVNSGDAGSCQDSNIMQFFWRHKNKNTGGFDGGFQ